MPILQDFTIGANEDGTVTIPMVPPTPIGGWSIQTLVEKRFGGVSGIIIRNMASGFYGVSGMNIVNSGQGIMTAQIYSPDTSGLDYGNYAYTVTRMDSGFRTNLSEGYLMLTPSR